MLGKLIKHECIATGRKYVIFYLVLAMVTLCNVLIQFISIDSVMIQGDCQMVAQIESCTTDIKPMQVICL